ncbi:unnamed protein product, partial [Polarella glacialis]
VDKYKMQPIDGVVQVEGDITHSSTVSEVLGHFKGERADLVVCDGAPDATGRSDFDEYVQHQLLLSELFLAEALLRPGGDFVAKIFRGEHSGEVYARLQRDFREVMCCKPRASRNSSQESFVVCRGFLGSQEDGQSMPMYSPSLHEELADLGPGAPTLSATFVACGGRDSLDADTNYPVDSTYQVLGPVAPPIFAPYTEAIEERRRGLKRPAAVAPVSKAGPKAVFCEDGSKAGPKAVVDDVRSPSRESRG